MAKGFTQKQLADAAVITRVQMRNIECGFQEPGAEKLAKIATVLGISMEEVLAKIPKGMKRKSGHKQSNETEETA